MMSFLRKVTLIAICLLVTGELIAAKKPLYYYVQLKTDKGEGLLRLYNETPLHRDNFVKLVKESYYDSLLFHRVIQHFMVQGGDPNSKDAVTGQMLGTGGPDYKVDAEIREGLFHKRGTLAAARDNNPEKKSSASQFYLVQGKVFTDASLDSLEQMRMGGKKFSDQQREAYKTVGGVPHLDGNYTVFGELMVGDQLIDAIAAVETDDRDRPIEDVRMSMTLLTRREALNLEREAAGLKAKKGVFTKFIDLFSSKYY